MKYFNSFRIYADQVSARIKDIEESTESKVIRYKLIINGVK